MSEEKVREIIVERSPEKEKVGFSEEYVHTLREEAAGWRVKYKDLKNNQGLLDVKSELVKRGVTADPGWVKIADGQSVEFAVEAFLKEYPTFATDATIKRIEDEEDPISKIIQKKVEISKAPKPKMPDPSSYGNESKTPQQALKNRQLDEIKKDPEARALLRRNYRSMLATQGHRQSEFE